MEINEKNKKKEQQALIIRKYQQYLKLEKSLSPNTLDAYLTDLDKLMNFLTLEGIDVLEVCLSDLQRFAAGLHDIGIHPRSQARILSGIKSFFRFLIMADYLEADPSELLEGPKIGLKLPEVLTVEEIDNIISSVDRSKAEGQRNRAILETLYSCGLRVSELVSLKLSDLYFDEGFIKVEGKGSKQRLVPISPRAINEIKLYFLDRNRIEVKKDYEDFVFVSQRRGKSLSRIMIFHMIKELAQNAGITKNISPHTFRHSFTGRWRQFTGHPVHARTRIDCDDRNLYPYRPKHASQRDYRASSPKYQVSARKRVGFSLNYDKNLLLTT